MYKFCVKGDISANSFFSSSIIINNLNEGAKKAGLYDENGKTVVYSTTCNDYGHKTDAFICVYETVLPFPVIQMANGRPIIGCSLDNLFFITDSYPYDKVGYFPLGVDTEIFKPVPRSASEKFRFLHFSESNARTGAEVVLHAFCTLFKGDPTVELYLKDRMATDEFKNYVKAVASTYKANVIHDTDNTQSFDHVKTIYSNSDVAISISRSSTWNMPALEAMAMGKPLIGIKYCGMDEFLRHEFNGIAVEHNIQVITQEHLNFLNSIGCRNHMFPLNSYTRPAYWAETGNKDLMNAMYRMRHAEKDWLDYLSKNAVTTAKQFTWEKSAVLLSCELTRLLK